MGSSNRTEAEYVYRWESTHVMDHSNIDAPMAGGSVYSPLDAETGRTERWRLSLSDWLRKRKFWLVPIIHVRYLATSGCIAGVQIVDVMRMRAVLFLFMNVKSAAIGTMARMKRLRTSGVYVLWSVGNE